jgi:hypothetical protein
MKGLRRPTPTWVRPSSVGSLVRVSRAIDRFGFELVRIRADATVAFIPDPWMPPDKAHLDAGDRSALVSDPDELPWSLRDAVLAGDGPHWDEDGRIGWVGADMPGGQRLLPGTDLESQGRDHPL